MMGCWLRKGCVSVGVWLLGVFVLAGGPAAVMGGWGSVLDCVRCGFMKWARGSNPEANSCVSRDGTETETGTGTGTGTGTEGGGTNCGLDWTT